MENLRQHLCEFAKICLGLREIDFMQAHVDDVAAPKWDKAEPAITACHLFLSRSLPKTARPRRFLLGWFPLGPHVIEAVAAARRL
jgi:hypothetical protein